MSAINDKDDVTDLKLDLAKGVDGAHQITIKYRKAEEVRPH